jgi:Ni/Co efflux regulator RcnB
MKRLIVTLALVALVACPALAQSQSSSARNKAPPKSFSQHLGAYAQVPAGERVDRETALRECNSGARGFAQYTYGHQETAHYRACMAQRGHME